MSWTRSSSPPAPAPTPSSSAFGRAARGGAGPADEKPRATNPALGAIPFVLLVLFAGSAAAATQPGFTAMANWKAMDNCARQAQEAFPDFTADSNAKRDAKLKECLGASNLPPRQPEIPAQSR
jgi:hypothetical protein